MKNKKEFYKQFMVIILILFTFFTSNCLSFFGISQPKILGLFIMLLFMYLFLFKKLNIQIKKDIFIISLIAISVSTFISILLNKAFLLTNFFEILRPIFYIMSIYLFIYLFNNKKNINLFNYIIYIIVGLFFLLGLMQFFNICGLNEHYIKIIAPTQYVTLVNGYSFPRIVGVFSNPNAFGFMIALINLYLVYLIIKKPKAYFLYGLIFINKITLYMTGSRTSFIIMIFSEFLLLFIYFIGKNKINIMKTFKVCFILGILELALLFILPTDFTWRIKTLLLGDKIQSWEIRKASTKNVYADYKKELSYNKKLDKQNPTDDINYNNEQNVLLGSSITASSTFFDKIMLITFGTGPQKGIVMYDNEWVCLFVNYGVFGILCFISLFILPILKIKSFNKIFQSFYLSIFGLNYLYMVAAGTFFSYTLFILFLLFIIVVYKGEKNVKN